MDNSLTAIERRQYLLLLSKQKVLLNIFSILEECHLPTLSDIITPAVACKSNLSSYSKFNVYYKAQVSIECDKQE